MTAHRCAACGKEAEGHWWSLDDNQYFCWNTEQCERRIAERNEEAQRMGERGVLG